MPVWRRTSLNFLLFPFRRARYRFRPFFRKYAEHPDVAQVNTFLITWNACNGVDDSLRPLERQLMSLFYSSGDVLQVLRERFCGVK